MNPFTGEECKTENYFLDMLRRNDPDERYLKETLSEEVFDFIHNASDLNKSVAYLRAETNIAATKITPNLVKSAVSGELAIKSGGKTDALICPSKK